MENGGEARESCEWCAQLVRGVGDELAAGLIETVHALLDSHPFHDASELGSYVRHRLEEGGFGRGRLDREELEHADHVGSHEEWEGEGAAQPCVPGRGLPFEPDIEVHFMDPLGLARLQHPSG